MTYPVTDTFSDPRGRWSNFVPYTTTERYDQQAHYLETQEHVDVRTFIDTDDWLMTIVSGANSDLIVDKIGGRSGWRGLQFTSNGAALNVTLTSSIPNDNLDLSHEHTLSMVFPDFNTFDFGTSWIQLTSHADGLFDVNMDSIKVSFSAADVSLGSHRFAQVAINMSEFQSVAQFDPSVVNGVRLHLVAATTPPAPTATVTVMAIRAVRDTWVESALDFDTRAQTLACPVSLDGEPYYGKTLKGIELIRGDGSRNDPIPINGTYNLVFSPGGELTSDLLHTLTGILGRDELADLLLAGIDINNLIILTTHYNQISLIARKIDFEPEGSNEEDAEDTGTGSYLKFNLFWNNQKTFYFAEKVTDSEESYSSETIDFQFLDTIVNPENLYAFSLDLVNETATVRLTSVDEFNKELDTIWSREFTSDSLTPTNGRVGFSADFLFHDAYIKDYLGSPLSFARLRSQVFRQRTPVDGAQLAGTFVSDKNLYTSVSGEDLFQDSTKTVSGLGSWRTGEGITTNDFTAEDWFQMYLRVAVWIGAGVTRATQPAIVLNTPGGQSNLPVPTLLGSQWNFLLFPLNIFHRHLEGLPYSFSFLPQNGDLIWVDNIIIGRRQVAWSMRATQDGPFRYFWDTVNNPNGGLHLPKNERGVHLQYQVEALTAEAWAAQPSLRPRHAQLGLPVYDENYEKR